MTTAPNTRRQAVQQYIDPRNASEPAPAGVTLSTVLRQVAAEVDAHTDAGRLVDLKSFEVHVDRVASGLAIRASWLVHYPQRKR